MFGRKGKVRSEKNGLSIIIVPALRTTRQWHVSSGVLLFMGVVAFLLLVVAGLFIHHYLDVAADIREIYHLRAAKHQQETQLQELDRLTDELAARLRYLEVADERIRTFLEDEDLLPEGLPSRNALEDPPVDRLWAVQTGSQAIGPTAPRDYHQLTSALGKLYERSADAEQSLDNLHRVILHAADYFRARPTIWPVIGRVSSGFGMRRSPVTGAWAFHYGIDIAANYGTEIRATADGVVEFSAYNGLYGNCIIIDHGYGLKTLYAHNWRNLVEVDDWVERGDVIALVGSTGRSTGPHLHYEVWVDGERKDPWEYHLSTSPR